MSSNFIGDMGENVYRGEGNLYEQLALFDKNGKLLDLLFNAPQGQQFGRLNAAWSSDGRYFAFIAFDYGKSDNANWYVYKYNRKNTLYIADMDQHKIINTCLSIGVGMAWSPDQHQLTFLKPGEGLKDVLIFDVDNDQLYSVAKHIVEHDSRNYFTEDIDSGILGWRAN